ncbi:hypothetical protein KIH31_15670 [Paenarthrobacter sp. DKR-5]|uniref:NucA/NucB deoxyribonuclease domain-containing protein n=1 Tax=Paenarthrobacter sp. DKR-5 TaxID=2835535 RepID=UPI001BDCE220|nr:RHS repeat-associated core domain-containing protein [Paenarthrobacter sp. DKR-5]MBT1004025.1 hypothetical protein [Paenarthrobacter sp. DKR-5]
MVTATAGFTVLPPLPQAEAAPAPAATQESSVPSHPWTPATAPVPRTRPLLTGHDPALRHAAVTGTGKATVTGAPLPPKPAAPAAPKTTPKPTVPAKPAMPTQPVKPAAGNTGSPAAARPAAPAAKTTSTKPVPAKTTGTTTTAAPMATASTTTTSSTDQGTGDFKAVPGVSAGAWGSPGQTGGFTWAYPFTLRSAPAGPTPSLSLSYDSTRVDGLTSSTNNQASNVGDGWALAGAGSIRQKFSPCMDQGVQNSYDLCGNPGGQSFTISFGGRSGLVIRDAATGTYRLQSDDNTRIEYLTAAGSNGTYDGGYWKLTDTSGTQYFFGRNKLPGWAAGQETTNSADTVPVGAATGSQPCAAGSFAASLCSQAYAWNLDYVVDVHGNSQAYYYTQDTNTYSTQAGTGDLKTYVRASRLTRIDYGMRAGSELAAPAPQRVVLAYTGRCTGVDCSVGNDIPSGNACPAAGPCTVYSPTFYSDQRLLTVTSQTNVTGTYQNADIWTLHHSMPDPGDGTSPALWLGSLDHQGANTATGTGGTIQDPPVVFSGQTLQNRVWVKDGLAPLDRYRISSIKTDTGAVIAVTYTSPECSPTNLPAAPETNTLRCFPQWWTPTVPIIQAPRMDYFQIYPVASVATSAGPGGDGSADQLTQYQYLGTPAWTYDGPKYVADSSGSQATWSVLAGWSQIKTTTGNTTANPATINTYLRGLDGTPSDTSGGTNATTVTASDGTNVTDSPWLAGTLLEARSYLGQTSTVLSDKVNTPWSSAPTATGSAGTGAAQARHTGTGQVMTRTASSTGNGWRTVTTTTTFDSLGRPAATSNTGDSTVNGADASCSTTSYADNTAANLLALPAVISTYAGECSNGSPAGNLLTSSRILYDGSTSADPGSSGYTTPTLGNPARTDTATAVTGTTVSAWQQGPDIAFDDLGRAVSSTDSSTGTARTTSTAYTPATGPVTSSTVTNPLGWTATTSYDAVRGQQTAATDANTNTTTYRYDASGRVTGFWDPTRPQASNTTPTTGTAYQISQTAPSWVRHDNINSSGAVNSSYSIYDGLGRIRQTQEYAPGGGTIAHDTFYNSIGAVSLVRNAYYFSPNPAGTLQLPGLAVPSSTQYDYDGAGRPVTVTALANDNQVQWTTNLAYTGLDTTTTTGPGNASATTVITNAEGTTASRVLYHGTTATGAADTSTYTYDPLGQLTGMKDTANNTWSWTFDAAGRQTRATDPDTGTLTTAWDASGRKASTTDGAGNLTAYTYDALDRVTAETVTPSGGTAHTLTTTTWDQEKKGQISSTTRYNGANYDQAVTTAVSGYNAAYWPKTTTVTLPAALGKFAGSYTTTTLYTKTGKISSLATPALGGLAAESQYMGYDESDRPSSNRNAAWDTFAGNTQYTNLGHLATYQQFDANGLNNPSGDTTGTVQTNFTWDATTGRLTNQSTTDLAKSVTTDLGKTTYTYDPSGRLTATDLLYGARTGKPEDTQCYAYDYASRLSAVWTPSAHTCGTATAPTATTVTGLGGPAPYAQTYTYTPAGDRSQTKRFGPTGALGNTETATYPAAGTPGPHQVKTITSTPATGSAVTENFTWDAAGRMTNRSGQTLTYTPDGLTATATGASNIPANPNPGATAGTPPAPAAGTATTTANRYYDANGTLVGITDGTGTTAIIGNITAFATTTGTVTATATYGFAGKTVAQRTAANGATKLSFILPTTVNTAQTLLQPSVGTTAVTTITRYTDPNGLARGPTQSATGTGAYATSPSTVKGVGTNAANPAGYDAALGYIGKLADTVSTLTHLGARDLDPVTGTFTTPDPILDTGSQTDYSPYLYAQGDPVNYSDPTGLYIGLALSDDEGSWHGVKATPRKPAPYVSWTPPWRPNVQGTQIASQQYFQNQANQRFQQTLYRIQAAQDLRNAATQAQTAQTWRRIGVGAALILLTVATIASAGIAAPETSLAGTGLVGGELAAEGAAAAARSAAVASESGLTDTGLADAAETGLTQGAKEIPQVTFSRGRAPGLARNFDQAVSDGAPTRLNRVTGNARLQNRREALKGAERAPKGQSLDEYPFACSSQGGAGSCVSAVPTSEQNYQGGVLSRFFQSNGIKDGEPFDVVFGP